MTPIGARCALRHDQKFVSRTPASVGLHHFHFPQRLADGLAEIVRQSTGTTIGRIAAGIAPCDSNASGHDLEPPPGALRRDRGGAAKRRFAGAGTPPASFFPARAVSSAFLLPVPRARELGFHRGR
jgi:hypothetical protein